MRAFAAIFSLSFLSLLFTDWVHASCICQTRNSGTTTVGYFNGQTHSVVRHVDFPASCANPHVVAQSYTSSIACGTTSGPSSCINNSRNNSTLVRPMVFHVTSTGFDVILSADDNVWVGASSPAFRIAYQYTCDSPTGALCACDSAIRGGTSSVTYTNGAQVSGLASVSLESCQNPVVLTQTYIDSETCGTSSGPSTCVNAPSTNSTDLFSVLASSVSSAGYAISLVSDNPVWVGAISPRYPIAHQTYCADHPDPAGRVVGGTRNVQFFNGSQSSTSVTVSVPPNCPDPRIVTQSYSSNVRCGTTSGASSCANNPANSFTYLQSFVRNVSSSSFEMFLAVDDPVWVGAVSPNFTIGYQIFCQATQCQDGIDNDGDGVIDAADPGCRTSPTDPSTYDPSRNNEAAATTQCQDNQDNDSDSLIDSADPGCRTSPNNPATYDRTRNNEAAATTQCQDGVDNDSDGVIDATDPGCRTIANNPATYDRTRNNEAAATTQCQDNLDNDGDGVIDASDPGCFTNPNNASTYDRTRDNEAAATPPSVTQCRDGIDNDSDGVIDAGDPGCRSNPNNPGTYDPARNNEAAATTQCQDGLDNDNDGLIDANDPGCWTIPSNPATYDRTRNNEASATTQCQDGVDNDQDNRVDLSDPGCSSPQDNSEAGDLLAPPTNVQASDNNRSGIRVTWNAAAGAASYEVYRSEEPTEVDPNMFRRIATVSSTDFFDTSAVPGRIYNFSIKSVNGSAVSAFSNVDSGLRPSDLPGGDSDGDGVSDNQEGIDGTDPMDAGSFALHLRSPAFSKYNTYLSQQNFLELVGDGTLAVQNLRITAYSLSGQPLNSTVLTVAAQTQLDLDINALAGVRDSYGVVKIEFNDALDGATLQGRMSNYRLDPGATTYSFAFTKELRNPTRGDTFAGANSFDPQGSGFLVPNWMEVINLDDVPRTFIYTLYSQDGRQLQQDRFTLAPLSERDIQAGHEFGQGVYLGMVQPLQGETKYFAGISRYSSNSTGGNEAQTYNYAFNLEARAGNGSSQFATTSNEVGGCFSQSNWFEVINVRSVPVTATVSFRNQDGTLIGFDSVQLSPKAQFHFNAGALLPRGSHGSVKLDASLSGGLVAQSLVYFHDCSVNRVQTAYAVQSRIPGQDVQTGSINSFLGMVNDLRIINSGVSTTVSTITTRPFGASQALPPAQFTLGASSTLAITANGANATFAFPANTYGTLKVQTSVPRRVVPSVLRKRLNPDASGRMDFVIPVVVQ